MPPARSPLASPSIGTATSDLIEPCQATPPPRGVPSRTDPSLAVALSGGGFRATIAGLGVLRFLADAGLLGRVHFSSSVSGGSVANACFAQQYDELRAEGFARAVFDRQVVEPFIATVSTKSLKWKLVRNAWRALGRASRTDVLARSFDDWFFHETSLSELTGDCRFTINAANLSTGVRFGFERDRIGDWVSGYVPTVTSSIRLAQAVAASAAVPGAFAPLKLRGVEFPCAGAHGAPLLVDGGAYDNLGLNPVDDFDDGTCLVALNAGGLFRTGGFGRVPIVRDLSRANSLLYRQTTALRLSTMVERFQAWEHTANAPDPPSWARRGVLFSLATTMTPPPEWSAVQPEVPPWMAAGTDVAKWRRQIALIKTSFNRFEPAPCWQLLYRGWWLAGATMTAFQRDLLPSTLPAWTNPGGCPDGP